MPHTAWFGTVWHILMKNMYFLFDLTKLQELLLIVRVIKACNFLVLGVDWVMKWMWHQDRIFFATKFHPFMLLLWWVVVHESFLCTAYVSLCMYYSRSNGEQGKVGHVWSSTSSPQGIEDCLSHTMKQIKSKSNVFLLV